VGLERYVSRCPCTAAIDTSDLALLSLLANSVACNSSGGGGL
jgi:hypothetical protein